MLLLKCILHIQVIKNQLQNIHLSPLGFFPHKHLIVQTWVVHLCLQTTRNNKNILLINQHQQDAPTYLIDCTHLLQMYSIWLLNNRN